MVKPDFEELVERHSAEIFAYVWRLLRETHDAEDCLQETFLRAFRSYGRVQAGHGAEEQPTADAAQKG